MMEEGGHRPRNVSGLSWLEKQIDSSLEPPERNVAQPPPCIVRFIRSLGLVTVKCLCWDLAYTGCLTNGHSDGEDVLQCWIPLNYLNGKTT